MSNKPRCGATTKVGGKCQNSLGCHHHKEHCRAVIAARAAAAVIPDTPHVQGEMFPLTLKQAMEAFRRGYMEEKAFQKKGGCGCY
jgi:hypothetical protein